MVLVCNMCIDRKCCNIIQFMLLLSYSVVTIPMTTNPHHYSTGTHYTNTTLTIIHYGNSFLSSTILTTTTTKCSGTQGMWKQKCLALGNQEICQTGKMDLSPKKWSWDASEQMSLEQLFIWCKDSFAVTLSFSVRTGI